MKSTYALWAIVLLQSVAIGVLLFRPGSTPMNMATNGGSGAVSASATENDSRNGAYAPVAVTPTDHPGFQFRLGVKSETDCFEDAKIHATGQGDRFSFSADKDGGVFNLFFSKSPKKKKDRG